MLANSTATQPQLSSSSTVETSDTPERDADPSTLSCSTDHRLAPSNTHQNTERVMGVRVLHDLCGVFKVDRSRDRPKQTEPHTLSLRGSNVMAVHHSSGVMWFPFSGVWILTSFGAHHRSSELPCLTTTAFDATILSIARRCSPGLSLPLWCKRVRNTPRWPGVA